MKRIMHKWKKLFFQGPSSMKLCYSSFHHWDELLLANMCRFITNPHLWPLPGPGRTRYSTKAIQPPTPGLKSPTFSLLVPALSWGGGSGFTLTHAKTILKYQSWYLYQISLQTMLSPTQIPLQTPGKRRLFCYRIVGN